MLKVNVVNGLIKFLLICNWHQIENKGAVLAMWRGPRFLRKHISFTRDSNFWLINFDYFDPVDSIISIYDVDHAILEFLIIPGSLTVLVLTCLYFVSCPMIKIQINLRTTQHSQSLRFVTWIRGYCSSLVLTWDLIGHIVSSWSHYQTRY